MYYIYKQDSARYVTEYIADSEDDIQELPIDLTTNPNNKCAPGSSCIIPSENDLIVYILGNDKTWYKI